MNNIIFYDISNETEPYKGNKYKLIEKINLLDSNQMNGLVPIVQNYQMQQNDQYQDDSKLEFDLHDLPNIKLKELHNYVMQCLQQQQN